MSVRDLLKRVLLFILTALLVTVIIRVARCDPFGGLPWPSHVEWTRYDTDEGWKLVRPAVPSDSVATFFIALELPIGTQIYVPRRVPGRDPEGEAQRRMKEAAH